MVHPLRKLKGIRQSWLVSYLVLLLFPFLFGIFIYGFSMRAIQREAEEVQYQALKHVGEALKSDLDNLGRMATSMLNGDEVWSLVVENEDGNYDLNQRKLLSFVKGKIKDTIVANDLIDELYIYFPKTGHMINSTSVFFVDDKNMFQYWFRTDKESLFTQLNQNLYQSIHVVKREAFNRLVYTSCTNARNELEEQSAVMIIYLSSAKLRNMLLTEGVTTILWQDKDKYLLYGPENEIVKEWLNQVDRHEESRKRESHDYLLQFPMKQFHLSVLHIIPNKLYLGELRQAVYILAGYILFCLVAGFVLMQYFLHRNYSPVRELLALTRRIGGNQQGEYETEYAQIRHSVEHLLEQYLAGKQALALQEEIERSMCFYRLLNGKNRYSSISEEDWQKIKSILPKECYLLFSIHLEQVEGEWTDADGEMISKKTRNLLNFIIKNVADELLATEWNHYGAAILDSYVFLLNARGEENEYSSLRDISRQIEGFLRQSYSVMLSFSISAVHEGRDGIRECWREIGELNQNRDKIENPGEILVYEDWKKRMPEVTILENAPDGEVPSEREGESKQITSQESDNIQEGNCGENRKKTEQEQDLMDQVASYIEDNYQDKTLSGGMLADSFGLSQSNLTQRFKRRKDVSIVEYIDYIRLEKAKHLLAEGLTVKDTADQVGYYNTRPLIRIFRDIEGVTPAEYRESVKNRKTIHN